MEILMLHASPRGGTFIRAFHLARELVRRGHRVTLFTSSATKTHFRVHQEEREGVRIFETPWPLFCIDIWELGFGLVENWVRLFHAVSRRFDLIHSFQHLPSSMLPGFLGKHIRHSVWISDWDDLWTEGGVMNRPKNFPLFYDGLHFFEHRLKRFADGVTVVG